LRKSIDATASGRWSNGFGPQLGGATDVIDGWTISHLELQAKPLDHFTLPLLKPKVRLDKRSVADGHAAGP